MGSRSSASHHLTTLSENGDAQQLFTALEWPSLAQVGLQTESVLIDAQVGVVRQESNLHQIVQLLLEFGQTHDVASKEMVIMDTMDAALHEKPLEVLLKFRAVDPNVFSHPLHLGSDILQIACRGGPDRDDAPRGKRLNFVQYLLEVEGRDPNTPNARPGSRRHRPGKLLYTACWKASLEIVESLLAYGAIVKGPGAMPSASYHVKIDVLDLLKYDVEVNELLNKRRSMGRLARRYMLPLLQEGRTCTSGW
ncbi:hypothetical protein BU25DRAFT_424606 [Macroventuria anomochaeta]|uniref:Uncharacterized protein n=1 Tax=Macroventuria anomochaeta TaxID=301207 RepID=A0ACB6RNU4_9PLEO|nr:uncharacterized protein BU25DRAFT_424606 [Macroventuria anomochaeta]KAF2623625.1 hypothetical protein BU25DRAFT_424606 [Macroventuria anomochaeta]